MCRIKVAPDNRLTTDICDLKKISLKFFSPHFNPEHSSALREKQVSCAQSSGFSTKYRITLNRITINFDAIHDCSVLCKKKCRRDKKKSFLIVIWVLSNLTYYYNVYILFMTNEYHFNKNGSKLSCYYANLVEVKSCKISCACVEFFFTHFIFTHSLRIKLIK